MDTTNMVLQFDGACTVNPGGQMSYGWHLDTDIGDRIAQKSGIVSSHPEAERTCHTAEFHALLSGLEWVTSVMWVRIGSLVVRGDSRLVVNVVNGDWVAYKGHVSELNSLCQKELKVLSGMCDKVVVEWVPRECNTRADELAVRELPPMAQWSPVKSAIPANRPVENADRPPGEERLPDYGRGMSRPEMVASITERARWYKSRHPHFDITQFLAWVDGKHEGVFRQYFRDIKSLIKRQTNGRKRKSKNFDWL